MTTNVVAAKRFYINEKRARLVKLGWRRRDWNGEEFWWFEEDATWCTLRKAWDRVKREGKVFDGAGHCGCGYG